MFLYTARYLLTLVAFTATLHAQDTLWLDRTWYFTTTDNGAQAQPEMSVKTWLAVDTDRPLDARYTAPQGAIVWYKIKFFLPKEWQKQALATGGLVLSLGRIDAADQLYLNGTLVAATGQFPPHYLPRADVSRTYTLPYDQLLWNYDNYLAVRVYVPAGGGGIYQGPAYLRPATLADALVSYIQLNSNNHLYPHPADTIQATLVLTHIPQLRTTRLVATVADSSGRVWHRSQTSLLLDPQQEEQSHVLSWLPPDEAVGFFCLTYTLLDERNQPLWADSVAFGIVQPGIPMATDPYHTIFWTRSVRELDAIPVAGAKLVPVPDQRGQLAALYSIKLPTTHGDTLCGWLSLPTDTTRQYSAWLVLADYGQPPQPIYGAAERIVLSLAVRTPGACGYPGRTYWQHSLHQPQDFALRLAYLDAVQGMRYLYSLPHTAHTVAQGRGLAAGMAIAAATLDKGAQACIAYQPYELELRQGPLAAWLPHLPAGVSPQQAAHTLGYFSPARLAAHMSCPLLVALAVQQADCPLRLQYPTVGHRQGATQVLAYTAQQGPGHLQAQVVQWLRSIAKK